MCGFGAMMAALLPLGFKRLPKEPRTQAERDLLAAQEREGRDIEAYFDESIGTGSSCGY